MPSAAPRRIGRGQPDNNNKRTPPRTKSHKFRAQDFVRKRQNESLSDHYSLGKLLGEGQFGEVFVGTVLKSNGGKGDNRAIKRIAKELLTEEDHDEVFNEFFILKQMDHPNVCKMYEFFEDKENFWFVQELCSGGELLDELERIEIFTEATAGLIMKQVLSSVHYCHSQKNVVHRDLKLENILLEGNQKEASTEYNPMIVKVIDFGLATTFTEGQVLTNPVGSMHYIAPEVLECEYGVKCDIWSCGVIAYILLCGYAPFEAANDRDMRELIMMGNVSYNDPIWQNNVSKEAKDFVSYLLTYEPDKRPDAAAALQHPWIQNATKAHAQQFKATKSGTDAAIKLLNNCRSFEAASKLKQATCAFMTSQLVLSGEAPDDASNTDATATIIGEIFRAMDLDSDGRLSPEELRIGFQDFLGGHQQAPLTVEEVDDIFARMDLSNTSFIDFSEFVVACMGLHEAHHEQLLKQAFERLLDKDGSGFISHEKLRKEMTPFYGEDVEEAIIQKIIDQADADQDGQVSWEDFKSMMRKTAQFVPPENATPLAAHLEEAKRKAAKKEVKELVSSPTQEAVPPAETVKVEAETKDITEEAAPADATASVDAATASIDVTASLPDADATAGTVSDAAAVVAAAPALEPREPQPPANDIIKTPPAPVRKHRPSVGPKARLISAMFEKNLEKNRAMGFEAFSYVRKEPKANQKKRNLPRTRRVNIEELTKKANTQIHFDAKKIMEGRNKEIEQFKATTGSAGERRASLFSMYQQEKQDGRRTSRLQELETIKVQTTNAQERRSSLHSSWGAATKIVEKQKREQRSIELQKLKESIVDVALAKKRLFEAWEEANARASQAEMRTHRIVAFRELKNFQATFDKPEKKVKKNAKFARRRAAMPARSMPRRSANFSWHKRLSGKSHTRESIHNNKLAGSIHSRPKLERTSSQAALHDVEQAEGRLVQMQIKAKTKKSARLVEPIRRLNSFDSQQEQDERDQRRDEMAPPSEIRLVEKGHTPQTLSIPRGATDLPPARGRLSSYDAPSQQRDRLQEMQPKNLSGATDHPKELSSSLHEQTESDWPKFPTYERRRMSTQTMASAAKREARLKELQQIKAKKSAEAKSAREKFEETIQHNKEYQSVGASSKSRGMSLVVGPTTDIPIAKLKRRSSIATVSEYKAPNSLNKSHNDEKKTETVPVGKTDTTTVPVEKDKAPASLNVSHHDEKKTDTTSVDKEEVDILKPSKPVGDENEHSMVGLTHTGNSSYTDSTGTASFGDLSSGAASPIIRKAELRFERSAPAELSLCSPTRVEKPAPRNRNRHIVTPKNIPRFGAPTTPKKKGQRHSVRPRGHVPVKASRRASASATMMSPPLSPGLTPAQENFLEMAKDRALKSKLTNPPAPAPAS